MNVSYVIIATVGRPELCIIQLKYLLDIIPVNWRIIVVSPDNPDCLLNVYAADIAEGCLIFFKSEKGLTKQRNSGLRLVGENASIVVFLDDDYFPEPCYFQKLEAVFSSDEVVGVNADTFLDGAVSGPVEASSAIDMLRALHDDSKKSFARTPIDRLYGCNMAIRFSTLQFLNELFDERLPLYGWLEDLDFSVRLSRHGKLVKDYSILGIHLGYRGGRTSGLRLGYSQVVNPFYLRRKGVLSIGLFLSLVGRPFVANIIKPLLIEEDIDRKGRLRGNLLGFVDVFNGLLNPLKVLDL